MRRRTRRTIPTGLALLALAVAGCGGASVLDGPDAGRAAAYQPGVPHLDFEAVPSIRGGEPGVDLYVSLPASSLVYARSDSSFAARYDLHLRVLDRRGREAVAARTLTDTVAVATFEATQDYRRLVRAARVPVPPGEYVVEAAVEDRESGARAERLVRVEVPSPAAAPLLGRIRLEAQADTGAVPVVALHVGRGAGPLRAITRAYGARAGSAVAFRAVRVPADTSAAYDPHWVSPSRGSLRYRGVAYDEEGETVHTARRVLTEPAGEEPLAFDVPELAEGAYRLEVVLEGPEGSALDREERALAVHAPAFPEPGTLDELIDALEYIATPRELAAIREGVTPQERRRRFDAFWGGLVDDRRVAQNLLRHYYERVEEANLLFTSHKPGWKTDRGMLYVVLGPPVYVEETMEGEVWYYDYGGTAGNAFLFERVDAWGAADPFQQVVLVRRPAYERAWERAVARWRQGRVL
ncbi:MAG: GWxTD domain-containing protein [Rhodothermales bacterium]|nr:GWxTD domain-containing protein [Rhodothermales bacterium]